MASTTITTQTITEKKRTYASETEWRERTQLTDTSEFPSSMIIQKLEEATEKVKRDGFVNIRLEFVTKDSNDRYFLSRRWLANAYGADVSHGVVTPRDLRVWESDETSSVSSAFFLQGSRLNRLMNRIPHEGITEWDDINGYFKLSSDWPSNSSYRIFADYWVSGKPLYEIEDELRNATIAWATVLVLSQYKKTGRMKNGVVGLSQGGRTIQRNEQEFDELVKQWYNQYHSYINFLRPMYNRKVSIGKWDSRSINAYPTGKINY